MIFQRLTGNKVETSLPTEKEIRWPSSRSKDDHHLVGRQKEIPRFMEVSKRRSWRRYMGMTTRRAWIQGEMRPE
ncbi:hypothetical protein F2Q68_00019974 [Brassica cretica]|uniref:Uncharacterized protein n=2 Tax=Brassica cretica TaxID=69181 RepID=A0A8S9FPJ0_BRACR|nr:hypothetical protein F2Q68_00019974 [Brassica cretica]KAF3563560.1 hypothetical protein DY000_02013178 [Brassica cretica]